MTHLPITNFDLGVEAGLRDVKRMMPSAPSLSAEQIKVLLAPINPRRVATREGLSNMEGYDIRAHLTRMFGFGRWDEIAVTSTVLLYEQPTTTKAGKDAFKVAYRAERALVIRDQFGRHLCRYEGSAVGESTMPDFKRGDAHDMAIKTAETQALKRAAVNLGDQFGLGLYAKGSTGALVRKVVGFDPEQHTEAVEMQEPDVVSGYDPDTGDEVDHTDDLARLDPNEAAPAVRPDPEPEAPSPTLPLDTPETDEDVPIPPDPQQPDPEPHASDAQIRKIQTLMGVHGIKQREQKLKKLIGIIKRDIASSKDMTRIEAHRVIEQLEADRAVNATT